jgi:molecular chaperone DnaK (HSP70)
MSDPAFIVGIDLGTTNSVLSYTEAHTDEERPSSIRVFKMPQLVGEGAVGERELLPSFVLLPGSTDVPRGGLDLPWRENASMAVGEFARERGAEIPHRLIASTKSWLCHSGVDRRGKILPWEGKDDVGKLSPVEASAAILTHMREAWNHRMAAKPRTPPPSIHRAAGPRRCRSSTTPTATPAATAGSQPRPRCHTAGTAP